ncbi:MAG: hypothetical protein KGH94_04220 [Candidatus Micrarchaeota archaeon]|nr:hypothetical protein [Candidatus Micrarchaeota archaeon]
MLIKTKTIVRNRLQAEKRRMATDKANVEFKNGTALRGLPVKEAMRIVDRCMDVSSDDSTVAIERSPASRTLGYSHIAGQDWKRIFKRE